MALSELKFVLSVDGAGNVTGNLKDVEGAVDSLGKKTTSATENMNKVWQSAEEQISTLRKTSSVVTDRLAADFDRLKIKSDYSLQQQKASAVAAYDAIKNSGVASANEIDRAHAALKTTLADLDREMENTGKSSGMMAEAWKMFSAAAIGVALGAIVKESIQAALQMERLSKLFAAAAGDANLAGRELEYIRSVSNRLGLDLISTADSYGKFLANIRGTTLEGEKGRKVFEAVSGAASALGLTTETTNRAFTALNQMLAKGTVSAEELRQQWTEAIPGGFKMAADAMGMTTGELGKALEQGKIMADDLLPRLADQLDKTYGQAALEGAKSAQAAINRMNNAMLESKATLGSALMPAFTDLMTTVITPLIKMIGDLVRALQSGAATAAYFVNQVYDGFKRLISGKAFTEKGYKESMANALENEKIFKAALDKIWAQPGSSAYTYSEKLRQAANTPTKPIGGTDKSADKAAADAQKWASTYAQLRKEIDALNPIMSAHDKKLLDISAKYADLERKKGANIEKLKELEKEHLQAIETAYQTAEAIKATIKEFAEYRRIVDEESKNAEIAQNAKIQQAEFREMVRLMDSAAKAGEDVADAVRKINAAFDDGQQSGAIEDYINQLFKLDDIRNSTADINISMADSDPAAQQMAAIEERYRREEELIQHKLDALEQAGLTETEMYQGLSDNIVAKAAKREQDIANVQRKESEKGWQGVVSVAQKAFPKLTGLDKLVTAAFTDHTRYRLATEEERAKGSEKLVKDEMRTNLAMTSAYTGAAASLFEGLAATQDQTSREGFENAKALNIASAVMNTASAVTNALATVQPFPAAVAAAAMAAAMGAIQIATIASTSFGGGATAPSAPSGSFASAGGASAGMGIANLQKPILSVEDTRTAETYEKLIASNQNIVMAIGRLSTALDDLSALFEEGGAGIGLATNAPGQNIPIGQLPTAMSKIVNDFKSIFSSFGTNIFNPANFINSTMDFLFGGAVTTIGAGITLAIKEGTVNAWDFVIQKKDGGLLGKDSSWANWVGNNDVGAFMSNLMQPYIAEMTNMAKTLGGSLDLSNFNGPAANILTSGKTTEEIGKELETWTKDTLNAMALMVDGLEENIGAYDNAYERLIALNNALVSTAEAFELIGKSTDNLNSFEAAKWVEALQIKMGGEDEFSDAIETYFSSLFTEEEQAAQRLEVANRKVKNAFIDMGSLFEELAKSTPQEYTTTQTRLNDNTIVNTLTEIPNIFEELIASGGIPKTRDEFKELMNSLDVMTESGAAAIIGLLGVSESFGLVMTSADETAEKNREIATKRGELEAEILRLTSTDETILIAERQKEVETLKELSGAEYASLEPLQQRIWRLQDEAAATAKATELSRINTNLTIRLMELQGKSAEALNMRRELEADGMDASTLAIQQQIWALEDQQSAAQSAAQALRDVSTALTDAENAAIAREKWELEKKTMEEDAAKQAAEDLARINEERRSAAEDAAAKAKELADQRTTLEIRIMELTGHATEALAKQREMELSELDTSLKPLQQRIWQLEDEAVALEKAREIADQRKQFEIEIMELTGNTAGALAAQRAIELAALDASLRPLQQRIWALQDVAKAEETAKESAKESANTAFETAKDNLQKAFDAEKDRLTELYETELELLNTKLSDAQSVVSDLADSVNMLADARKKMTLEDESYQRMQYTIARQQLAQVLAAARNGDISGVKDMSESLDILTGQGKEAYADSVDYQRDFWVVSNSIGSLEKYTNDHLTEAEQAVELAEEQIKLLKTNHDAQMSALDAQLNALLGINTSILSLADAIRQFETAKEAVRKLNPVTPTTPTTPVAPTAPTTPQYATTPGGYQYLTSIPLTITPAALDTLIVQSNANAAAYRASAATNPAANAAAIAAAGGTVRRYATGGITSGISIAGEAGPEAVVPLPDGRTIPVRMTGYADNAELVAEIRAMRVELKAAQTQIAKNTLKTAKYIERWDGDGLPEERAVA